MPTTVVKTIRASGGDYTTLSAWEAANQGDLVAADEVRVAECYNDWPGGLSDKLVIDGSITDATRYLMITVAAGHRHTGIPQSGFYIKKNVGYDTVVRDSDPYTRLAWLDLENTNSDGQALYANAGLGIYSNLIAKTAGTSQYVVGLYGQNITIHGALVYGGGSGVQCNSTISANIYNSVATGCVNGFNPGSSTLAVLKNCVAHNNTTNYSGTFGAASANNATSSASDDAPGANSVVGITSADFVNAAGNDFHLAAGSALIGAGVNLYADLQADVDGDAWPSSGAWDIGFDSYVAGGGGITIDAAVCVAQASGLPAGIVASTVIAAQVGNAAAAGLPADIQHAVAIQATVGDAAAAGSPAAISQGIAITAGIGNAEASGLPASLSTGSAVEASTGDAQATGLTAGISAATTIAATRGDAEAAGLPAGVSQGVVIVAGVGAASAAGRPANIAQAITITTSAGNAAAAGITAAIEAAGGEIACLVGDTAARGLVAGIAANVTVHASVGSALAVGLPSVMSTGDGAQTVLSAPRAVYSNIQTAARSNIQTARRPRS